MAEVKGEVWARQAVQERLSKTFGHFAFHGLHEHGGMVEVGGGGQGLLSWSVPEFEHLLITFGAAEVRLLPPQNYTENANNSVVVVHS